MSNGLIANVPRLKGRENYREWAFAITHFLTLDKLTEALEGTETNADKIAQAKSKLVLSIDSSLFIHIESATTAKELWDKLAKLYADTAFSRRITLLRRLISSRRDDFEDMQLYVNSVIDTAQKLTASGLKVGDDWIGCLLLAGLPTPQYTPMIMAIEHSGIEITSDSIKMKLG